MVQKLNWRAKKRDYVSGLWLKLDRPSKLHGLSVMPSFLSATKNKTYEWGTINRRRRWNLEKANRQRNRSIIECSKDHRFLRLFFTSSLLDKFLSARNIPTSTQLPKSIHFVAMIKAHLVFFVSLLCHFRFSSYI